MAHADKPKTKRPYTKVRMVPEDSKMKDHEFYYYAFKPGKGEKKKAPEKKKKAAKAPVAKTTGDGKKKVEKNILIIFILCQVEMKKCF